MPQNFCEDDDSGELVNRTHFDYMMLFKALDPIKVSTKEFLEGKMTPEEAYKKIKLQYSTYRCKLKKDIDDSRSNKDTLKDIFHITIIAVSATYSIYVVYQIFKVLTGSCRRVNKYSLPLLYSIMSLVLFNPLYSLITVTFDILKYRAFQQIEKSKLDNLNTIESAIESSLNCESSANFTQDIVCNYYKHFDKDNLCESSADINANEMMTDFITNKMEKLDNVNQFFNNQKKFMLKIHNPYVEIKKGDKIDPIIQFLLGSDIEKVVRDNLNTSEVDHIFSENSQQIRNKIQDNLKLIEVSKYNDIGVVVSYQDYFLDELNNDIKSLTMYVLIFLEKSDYNRDLYFKRNNLLKNYKTDNNYLFYCTGGTSFLPLEIDVDIILTNNENLEDVILEKMFNIQTKLRRLNKLWLPEYEYLRKILYEPVPVVYQNMNDKKHVVFKTDLKVQRAMYRTTSSDELRFMLKDIIAIVLENTHLINFDHTDMQKIDHGITPRCNINNSYEVTDHGAYRIKIIDKYNIEDLYPLDYRIKDTVLIPKVKNFVKSLRKDPLPNHFKTQFKVETTIVKNIIINELNTYMNNHTKIVDYIKFYITDNNVFTETQQNESITFLSNCNKLITFAHKQHEQETKNSELYFNTNKTVEYPEKYISFEEFELKLNNIEKYQYSEYLNTIESVKHDVSYFIEKLDNMNDKLESKIQMTEFYNKYIIIYVIASFIYLLNVSIDTYFNINELDEIQQNLCSFVKGDSETEEKVNSKAGVPNGIERADPTPNNGQNTPNNEPIEQAKPENTPNIVRNLQNGTAVVQNAAAKVKETALSAAEKWKKTAKAKEVKGALSNKLSAATAVKGATALSAAESVKAATATVKDTAATTAKSVLPKLQNVRKIIEKKTPNKKMK